MSRNFFCGENINASSLKYFTDSPSKEYKVSKEDKKVIHKYMQEYYEDIHDFNLDDLIKIVNEKSTE